MRIVFCGTPAFAVPTLKAILADPAHAVVAVITQPDRPRGRGQEISFSAVKQAALDAGVAVRQPERIRAPEAKELLQTFEPECFVIIAYGQIIPASLLPISKCGWINLHASLLPKYRGAAPINWAIANGETKTGLTTMRIDVGMDTGDMLLQEEVDIEADETAAELTARMSEIGAALMIETLRGLPDGLVTPKKQNDALATHAPLLTKEDGRIDWTLRARDVYNRMRGFAPWPGAFTTFRGKTCQLWGEPAQRGRAPQEPGTILIEEGELRVACGDATVLRVLTVKQEGRSKVTGVEFANGARLAEKERFGHS
ncbi:MAG: methionyl-tRNA formyltransferase [Acidobacteriota bacterium]|nr:methionyl-tRNA formyltransferase [Acidobacteriota bacterium]